MPYNPGYADAISSIESGGKYDILGPATKSGDQAYGKYQIMGANIGPWSKEILGKELTPEEFLANPQAQDAVFQGKFSQYVDQYGPEGAAQAWIGGPGGVGKLDRKDSLGTSVGAYGQKFMAALGGQPQQSPAFNQPPQQTASLPAYGWSPATQLPGQPDNSMGGLPTASQNSVGAGYAPTSQPMAAFPWMAMPQRRGPDLTHLARLLSNAPASIRGLVTRG